MTTPIPTRAESTAAVSGAAADPQAPFGLARGLRRRHWPSISRAVAGELRRPDAAVRPARVAVVPGSRPLADVAGEPGLAVEVVAAPVPGAGANGPGVSSGPGSGDLTYGACVLDGALESAADPEALISWAYEQLTPGAPLVVVLSRRHGTGNRPRRRDAARARAEPHVERARSLLSAGGFERPKLIQAGDTMVISALRSALLPPTQRRRTLSVVVPAYNEVASFAVVMEQLVAKTIPETDVEIVVVESNSTDGTRQAALSYADHPRVRLVLQDRPRGKGNAVRAGLEVASGDFLLIQDADLEYDIADYERLLEPLQRYETAFVLGARRQAGHSWKIRDFGKGSIAAPLMNAGHLMFLTLFDLVYGERLHDPFTMYKVIRRDALFGLSFECDRFDFDWELVGKLVRAGYRPREVLVSYRSRSFAEGKKISPLHDSVTWVRACFKYRFTRLYPW